MTALNILLFGNSFSQYGQYHELVAELADAAGYDKPIVVEDYIGGGELEDHLEQVQLYPGNNVQSAELPTGDTWDYVVLQGASQEFDDAAFTSDALALFAAVRDHASGNGANSTAVLFQTWAYNADYTPYPSPYTDPYDMQAEIVDGYAAAKTAIDGAYTPGTAIIARVGEAFQAAGFAASLYNDDHFHPGRLGPALTAMVVYRTIYGHNLSEISYSSAETAGFCTHFVADYGNVTLTTDEYAALQNWADSLTINTPPTAILTAAPTSGIAPYTVTFDASGSSDSDGTIELYALNYGDGSAAVELSAPYTAAHEYTVAGTYTATLTVVDNSGDVDYDSVTITVAEAEVEPEPEPEEEADGTPLFTPLPLGLAVYDRYESSHGVLITIESPSGTVYGPGPINTATEWTYSPMLNGSGTFSFAMPAADSKAQYVDYYRIARAQALLYGEWHEVGVGVIDSIERDTGDPNLLRVSGNDQMIELAFRATPDLKLLTDVEQDVTVSITTYGGSTALTLPDSFTLDGYSVNPQEFIYFKADPDRHSDRLTLTLGTNKNTTTGELHWQYYNQDTGDWENFTATDTTIVSGKPFAQSGTITYVPMDNWDGNEIRAWFEGSDMSTVDLSAATVHYATATATPLATVMALAPSPWALSSDYESETGRSVYVPDPGDNVLAALVSAAQAAGESFRLGASRVVEWLGDTYAHSGIYARGPSSGLRGEQYPQNCQLVELSIKGSATDLVTRVYPYGGGDGDGRVTLAETSISARSGYTMSTTDNYIERTGAETFLGWRIDRVIEDTRFVAADASDEAVVAAADQLAEWAHDWLAAHSATTAAEISTAYNAVLAGLHTPIYPGQKIGVAYRKYIGEYLAMSLDRDLVVLQPTMRFSAGQVETVAAVLSTEPPVYPRNDAMIVVNALRNERGNRVVVKPETGFTDSTSGVIVGQRVKAGKVVSSRKVVGKTGTVVATHGLEVWRLYFENGIYVDKEDIS